MFNVFQSKNKLPFEKKYFLSLFSGVEGGLATTAAIIAGLVVSGDTGIDRIIVIAIISFAVQAFNGAVGRFSGEHTSDEIDNVDEIVGYRKAFISALLQFIAHVAFSALIVIPYFYIENLYAALAVMVAINFSLMFLLGVIKAAILHNELKKDGSEMFYMAFLVLLVGSLSGLIVRFWIET